jgi:diguanylate cyclase (GGDEF)-like protein
MARILVVDDEPLNRHLLRACFGGSGHEIVEARDGFEALIAAEDATPDLVLLDVMMPGMDGFETCSRLKAMAETESIPVVFLTANQTEERDLVRGLDVGGNDYVVKPVSRAVLLARVAVMLRIRRTEERIRQLSMIDEFTGLFSRNYVLRRLDEEMVRARRRNSPLVVAMLDLDDFKLFNDNFGHQFGDEVLKRVSASLKANVRLYDSIGRYGGEEFLLVQPETSEADGLAAVERLQAKAQEERFESNGAELRVTFSVGLVVWDLEATLEELVRQADCALYAAKHAGKNQIVLYSEVVSGKVSAPASAKVEGGARTERRIG